MSSLPKKTLQKRRVEKGVGRDYNITLNFRCKLLIRSSYSYSALSAYPFGHHSRNRYLIPLAEGLFESPTGIPRRGLQKILRQGGKVQQELIKINVKLTCHRVKCKEQNARLFYLFELPLLKLSIYYILFIYLSSNFFCFLILFKLSSAHFCVLTGRQSHEGRSTSLLGS